MNFQIRKLSLAAMIAGSAVLSGCTNLGFGNPEYACSGLPEKTDQGGVKCMSARQVYESTERPGPVDIYTKPDEQKKKHWWSSEPEEEEGEGQVNSLGAPAADLSANNAHPLGASPISSDPVPIRSRAKILRIWIGPWESTAGDLNASGLVFTELEGRRWSIGAQESAAGPALQLLSTRVQAPEENKK